MREKEDGVGWAGRWEGSWRRWDRRKNVIKMLDFIFESSLLWSMGVSDFLCYRDP